MVSISLIIFFSVVLFVYWFRYSCLLILQNRGAYAVSQANAAALTLVGNSGTAEQRRDPSGVA